MATAPHSKLKIAKLDLAVQYFCEKGLADSTHKVYQSAIHTFTSFCSLYSITIPFPVSEAILCYYVMYLAGQHLSPQTIKTYLAGIRHTQILLGLSEPREFSSLSRLQPGSITNSAFLLSEISNL